MTNPVVRFWCRSEVTGASYVCEHPQGHDPLTEAWRNGVRTLHPRWSFGGFWRRVQGTIITQEIHVSAARSLRQTQRLASNGGA